MDEAKRKQAVKAFENAINSLSLENDSNTPDFILAEYLISCLEAFNKTSSHREKWYGKSLSIGDPTSAVEGVNIKLPQQPPQVAFSIDIKRDEGIVSMREHRDVK